MFEVGEKYETKVHGEFECIAVTETHAWMKSGEKGTGYVWTQEGKSVSLSQEYDIKPKPRDFWICKDGVVYERHIEGSIHVREVLE